MTQKDHPTQIITLNKAEQVVPAAQPVMSSAQKLMTCLGHMLSRLVQESPAQKPRQSRFYCKTKPGISILDYLRSTLFLNEGIHRFANCTEYIFLKALIYMDRFQTSNQDFILNQFSIHRQIICAVMIAAKYSQDFYFTNKHYAKVGGISEQDLNLLEREFLDTIDYWLYVQQQQLAQYADKLNNYYEMMISTQQAHCPDGLSSPAPTNSSTPKSNPS